MAGPQDPAGRRQLRGRVVARARSVGADRVGGPGHPLDVVRRHLPQQQPQERRAADRRRRGDPRPAVRDARGRPGCRADRRPRRARRPAPRRHDARLRHRPVRQADDARRARTSSATSSRRTPELSAWEAAHPPRIDSLAERADRRPTDGRSARLSWPAGRHPADLERLDRRAQGADRAAEERCREMLPVRLDGGLGQAIGIGGGVGDLALHLDGLQGSLVGAGGRSWRPSVTAPDWTRRTVADAARPTTHVHGPRGSPEPDDGALVWAHMPTSRGRVAPALAGHPSSRASPPAAPPSTAVPKRRAVTGRLAQQDPDARSASTCRHPATIGAIDPLADRGPEARPARRPPTRRRTLSATVDGRTARDADVDYTSGVEPCNVLDSIIVAVGPTRASPSPCARDTARTTWCASRSPSPSGRWSTSASWSPGTYTISDSDRRRGTDRGHRRLTAPAAPRRRRIAGDLCDDRAVNPIDAVTLLLVVVAVILGWRSGRAPAAPRARWVRSSAGAAILSPSRSLADPWRDRPRPAPDRRARRPDRRGRHR